MPRFRVQGLRVQGWEVMKLDQLETSWLVNGLIRISGGAPAGKEGRAYS